MIFISNHSSYPCQTINGAYEAYQNSSTFYRGLLTFFILVRESFQITGGQGLEQVALEKQWWRLELKCLGSFVQKVFTDS